MPLRRQPQISAAKPPQPLRAGLAGHRCNALRIGRFWPGGSRFSPALPS